MIDNLVIPQHYTLDPAFLQAWKAGRRIRACIGGAENTGLRPGNEGKVMLYNQYWKDYNNVADKLE